MTCVEIEELLNRQLGYILTRSPQEPAAVVIHPDILKRWLDDIERKGLMHSALGSTRHASGWAWQNLPIYRCWELPGPSVLTRRVLDALTRSPRRYTTPSPYDRPVNEPVVELVEDPLLF